jgi:hypothetical protein
MRHRIAEGSAFWIWTQSSALKPESEVLIAPFEPSCE